MRRPRLAQSPPPGNLFAGIVRLTFFNPSGFAVIGGTPEAFLSSLSPLIALLIVGSALEALTAGWRMGVLYALSDLCVILGQPVLSHLLARSWNRERQWLRYATAMNWCLLALPLVASAFLFLVVFFAGAGPSPRSLAYGLIGALADLRVPAEHLPDPPRARSAVLACRAARRHCLRRDLPGAGRHPCAGQPGIAAAARRARHRDLTATAMTVFADLRRGLLGGARLAAGRAEGVLTMRLDPAGVRTSFLAVLICLPIFLFLHYVDWRQATPHAPLWQMLAVQFAAFAIGWAGFLLACHTILRAVGRDIRFQPMVAVWNWCNVVQHLLWLAATLPVMLHGGNIAIEFAALVTFGWQLWLEWFALRLVLDMSALATAGLVLLDVTIGLLIETVTASILG